MASWAASDPIRILSGERELQHEGLGGRAFIDAAQPQHEQVTLTAAEGDPDGRAAFDRRSGWIEVYAIAVHAQRTALSGERDAVERDGGDVLEVTDWAAEMAATGFGSGSLDGGDGDMHVVPLVKKEVRRRSRLTESHP